MSAVEAFTLSALCSEVHSVLLSHLIQVFGDEYDTVPLAVRSSASGNTSVKDVVLHRKLAAGGILLSGCPCVYSFVRDHIVKVR